MSIDKLNTWLHFLQDSGAVMEQGKVLRFAASESQETRRALGEDILCDLSHYGLIRISGDEAESFLQNQFCNDVSLASEQISQLNAYCNPKGRALAFFRLFKRDGHFYLRLPREILEPTLKRLSMFVLMTKAKLEDVGGALIHIGLAGAHAEPLLEKILGAVPKAENEVCHVEGISVIRASGAVPRFEIYAAPESMQSLWDELRNTATPVGHANWELLDIHAGVPEIYPQTVEAFVPQMLNLQAINALSFKKGCYPGQEIVARMHYLGKLKRRMYLAHVDDDALPEPGEPLFAAGSDSGQGVGKVVRAQYSPEGGIDLLAVIEISSAEQRTIHLKKPTGPLMNLADLPYSMEEPE